MSFWVKLVVFMVCRLAKMVSVYPFIVQSKRISLKDDA